MQERVVGLNDSGVDCEGLLVWDDVRDAPRPAVIVAPTIFGRTDFEDDKARALAGLGYTALSIDLYGIETRGGDIDDYRPLMDAHKADRPALQKKMSLWLETLCSQPEADANRTAAIGFCFGGLCVLDLARSGAGLGGVVSFHGLFDPPGNTAGGRIAAKILALHGWDDPLATPEKVVALAQELTKMGADWQIHAYGNTLHAFTNPAADERDAGKLFSASANRRSWAAMTDFFAELFGD